MAQVLRTQKKVILTLALLACCLFFVGSAALAAPSLVLDAPESVARGDAFPALAVSDAPTKAFTFRWLGKTYEARAEQVSVSSAPGSAAGAAMRWQAVILLPVPLEEKEAARQNCVRSREGVQMLESGVRISRYNAKGERETLDDKGREEELEKARKAVKDWCN